MIWLIKWWVGAADRHVSLLGHIILIPSQQNIDLFSPKIFYGPFNFCMGHLHRITKLYVSNGPWPLPFPITALCNKDRQWLAAGRWFSLGTPVSSKDYTEMAHWMLWWWGRNNHFLFPDHCIMLYTSPWSRFELTTSVVIDTDCIGSCKSNYHTITATTAPCIICQMSVNGLTWQSSKSYLFQNKSSCLVVKSATQLNKKNKTSMARDMGAFRDSQAPFLALRAPDRCTDWTPLLIGPDSRDESVIALFNLSFPFSILQSTYKYKSECEENVFLVSNKIC
jgi:hypothetical protein